MESRLKKRVSKASGPAFKMPVLLGLALFCLAAPASSGSFGGSTHNVSPAVVNTGGENTASSASNNLISVVEEPGGASYASASHNLQPGFANLAAWPATITDLSASTGAAAGSVLLKWNSPRADGSTGTAAAYEIRVSTLPASAPGLSESQFLLSRSVTDYVAVPSPAQFGTTEQLLITGLEGGTSYYFAIKARSAWDAWSYLSNAAAAGARLFSPATSGFSGVAVNSMQFSWTGTGNAPGATRYRVLVSTAADPLNPSGAVVSSSDTYNLSLSSAGLAANTTYYFRVAGLSNLGELTAYTLPAGTSTLVAYAPGVVSFPGVFVTSVQFSWAANGNPYPGTLFRVLSSTAPDPLNPSGAVVSSSDTYSLNLTSSGLRGNTTYYFAVAGVNNNGVTTAYTAAQLVWTLADPPVFTGFTNVTGSTIKFNWTAAANPYPATQYRVQYSTAPDPLNPSGAPVDVFDTPESGLLVGGLASQTTYYFRVAALENSGSYTAYTPAQSTVTLNSPDTKLYLRTATASLGSDSRQLQPVRGSTLVTYTKSTVVGPVTPPTAATNFTATAGGSTVTWYTYPVDATTIAGKVTFNLWARESATAANATINAQLARADAYGNVISTITTVILDRTELTTTLALRNWFSTPTVTGLENGERLAVMVHIDDGFGSTMASGRNVTMTLDGPTAGVSGDSWIQTSENLSPARPVPAGMTDVQPRALAAGWSLVEGATGYTLAASLSPDNPPASIYASSETAAGSAYVNTPSLDPNSRYYLFVRTNGWGGSSSWAAYPGTHTLLEFPPAFSNFSSVGSGSLQFNWSHNGNAAGTTLYRVRVSTAADPLNPLGAAVTSVDTYSVSLSSAGLVPNTTYYFRAAGVNKDGVETAYTAAVGTATLLAYPPAAPAFGPVSENSIRFDWDRNGNAANTTLYRVFASTAADPLSPAGAPSVSSQTYNVYLASAGLSPNTTYSFTVAGVNHNGVETSYTPVLTTATLAGAPAFSSFSGVGPSSVNFSWTQAGNPDGTLYLAAVSTAPDPMDPKGALVTSSATYNLSLSTSGLAVNTTYYFRAAAVNRSGVITAYSAPQATSTLANAPLPSGFTGVAASAVQFNWSANGNPDPGTLYRVAVSTAPDPLSPGFALVTASNTYNAYLSSSGLSANTTYYFRVAAINRGGGATAYSAPQGTSTLLAADPSFSSFAGVGVSSVQFNWSANGNAANTTLYRVVSSTAPNPLVPGGAVAFSSYTYGVSLTSATLNPNVTYYFTVAGVNNNGVETGYMAVRGTSTLAAQPSSFDFSGISSYTVRVEWSAGGNNPRTLYRVLTSTAADPQSPGFAAVTSSDTYNNYLSTSGLMPNVEYYFKAAAFNGNSVMTNYSAAASTHTLGLGSLGAPVASAVTNIYASSMTAAWTLVGGATGYTLAASPDPYKPPVNIVASSMPVGAGALSSSVEGLTPDASYYLFVQANGPGAASAWSDYPPYYTLLAAPPAFLNFSNVGTVSADFNWSANGNAANTTKYRVVSSTAPDPLVPAGAVAASSDTYNVSLSSAGLSPNATYYFRVAGVNKAGAVTSYTAPQSTVTWAAAPSLPGFSAVGSSSLQFSWSASGNPARTLYVVAVSTAADPLNPGTALATSSFTYNLSLSSAGLAADTTYYFRVAAYGHNGYYTAYTSVASTATLLAYAPGAAPFTGISTGSIQFNWSANGNAAGSTRYRVLVSTAADPLSPNGAVVTSSYTYNLFLSSASLGPNAARYFRVAGLNKNDVYTAYTAAAGTSTLTQAPLAAVPAFSGVTDSGFTAAWSGGANPPGTLYVVKVSTAQDFNPGATDSAQASTVPVYGLSYGFTGLNFSTTYYFRAWSVNNDSVASAYSDLGSTRTLGLQTPSVLPVTDVFNSSMTAAWTLSAGATGYTLAVSVNPGSQPSPVYASSTTYGSQLSATVSEPALDLNTTYYLFVRANGPRESSPWAAYPATSTLANMPVSAASTFSAVSFNSFSVSWGANGNALGSTLYTVQVSTAYNFNSGVTDQVTFTTAPAAGPGAEFSGLNVDSYYYFRVRTNYHNGNFSDWINLGNTKTKALPVIHAAGDGMILYGQAGNSTPQFRNYSAASNTFGSVAASISGVPGSLYVIKANPLSSKQEAVAGYVKDGVLHVLCTDGTNWSEDWTQVVGGNETTRRFDIGFETNTGDVMVLYSQDQGAANELGYRTKPGASDCGSINWSANTNLDPARTSGVVQWVKLASDRRVSSGTIAAIWADANSDLSAMVWDGSAWQNEPSSALDTSLEVVAAAQDVEDFDVEFESLSGDLMVVWSNSAGASGTNGVRYATATWTGGSPLHTWGNVVTPATFADDATNLDLAANPSTNEMVFASLSIGGAGFQTGYWSGTAWTNTANVDTTHAVPAAGTKLVAAGWLTSGATSRSVVTYADNTGPTLLGWYVGTSGSFAAQTDFSPTPVFASPQKYYDIQQDPVNKDRLIFTVTDGANGTGRLFAKRLIMTATPAFTWTNADGGAALETALSSVTVGGAKFVYWGEPSTTTFSQSSYRFFAGNDGANVGAALAAQDAPAEVSAGSDFRLRELLHVGQVDLPVNSQSFKLQYAGKGDGTCDAPANGSPAVYTDVTLATLIAYKDNPSVADNAALTANALDPKHGAHITVNQSYEELNNSTNTVAAVARNKDAMWDFSLKDNGMTPGTVYCLRLVKANDAPLYDYSVYPEVMVPAVVYLNEIYPTGPDAANDWVELYNNTASTPSLVGWKLQYVENTIDLGGTPNTVWTGQAGDVINSMSTFTISGLSMDINGGLSYHLRLLDSGGRIVDQAQWPALGSGQSFARITDGNPSYFEIDPTPTKGYANDRATDTVRINEVSYAAGRQFVELYNASAVSTQTLAGYSLRNSAASSSGIVFRFTRKIYPGNYAVIDFSSLSADSLTFPGVFGANGPAAGGDFLALENSTGSVVDAVTWQADVGYSRYNYKGELVSYAGAAPGNASKSIARQPSEGSDTGVDSADFASSAGTTLASRNNGAGAAAAAALSYPAEGQVLPRRFPLNIKFNVVSSSYTANNLVLQRTGGAADPKSPHLYRLQDIGFGLGTLTPQATAQFGLSFADQEGNSLVSSATYRLTLNTDTGSQSAPQVVLGTVTYDASVHSVSAASTTLTRLNDGARGAALRVLLGNNSPAGFNPVELGTVTFMLMKHDLSGPLSQAQARSLFNAVMLVRESASGLAGIYEPSVDVSTLAYVPMASIALDSQGGSTLTVTAPDAAAASAVAGSTQTFYVVFEATQNASANAVKEFRVRFDGRGGTVLRDGPTDMVQEFSAAAQLDASSVTIIAPSSAPAGTAWPYVLPSSAPIEAPVSVYYGALVSSCVYVGSTDGLLRAVYSTGTVKWSYTPPSGGPITTSPSEPQEEGGGVYVYFANDNGYIYKVRDTDSAAAWQWTRSIPTTLRSDLMITGSKIFVGGGDNRTYCLNTSDGLDCADWTHPAAITAPITSALSVDERSTVHTAWAGLEDGKVVSVRTTDGGVDTSFQTGGPIRTAPLLDAAHTFATNNLYITSTDGKLYARSSGNLTVTPGGWTDLSVSTSINSSPFIWDSAIYFGDDLGRLHKVDAGTGGPVWTYQAGAAIRTIPLLVPGGASFAGVGVPDYVYFGSDDGYIYSLDAVTAAPRQGWPVATGAPVRSDPIFDAETKTVIVGSGDGRTYSLYVGP